MTEAANDNGASCRAWWNNCGVQPDEEILAIDAMEDEISPLADGASRTRKLIATFEACHHKAERWVHNIIQAIGAGDTAKGLGTRPKGDLHRAEKIWQDACKALSAWCAGSQAASVDIAIGETPASCLLERLGTRSHLKEWQVQRVIERVRDFIAVDWSKPEGAYVPILEYGSDYESARRTECPEYYREHADFWQQTAETTINDTENGRPAKVPLAVAIDLQMACHWSFVENLETVLAAIGGDLHPTRPLTLCARNIHLSPIRDRMREVCHTLRVFTSNAQPDDRADTELLTLLGTFSNTKKWLAASLEKTMRLQLDL